ncbi:unnamed protein product, partial [Timema podura]|nr:unnamed protein product [Timema podura]
DSYNAWKQSVVSDVRLILTILQQQQQQQQHMQSSQSSGSSMMPDYRESSSEYGIRSGKSSRDTPPHVQRSYSASQDSPSNFRTSPSSPERDSNLNPSVLSSLAQHETSALANYATDVGHCIGTKE